MTIYGKFAVIRVLKKLPSLCPPLSVFYKQLANRVKLIFHFSLFTSDKICAHFSTPDSSATLREPFVKDSDPLPIPPHLWGGC